MHFLLTRFNVEWAASLPADPSGKLHLDPGWLAPRLQLFERVCLPSVVAQTCRDFRWLLFASEETPEPFRSQMSELASAASVPTEIVWSGPWDDSLPAREVAARTSAKTLTTRLDNDDAIARTHVGDVQAAAVSLADGATIAPRRGFQLYLDQRRAYTRTHQRSPFLTLVEDRPTRTALGLAHARIGASVDLAGPQFLQTIHGQNIDNPRRGRVVASKRQVLAAFGIDPDLVRDTTATRLAADRAVSASLLVARAVSARASRLIQKRR